jgi:hypothetical protein
VIYLNLSQALRKAFLFPANARQSVYASGACDKELETNRLAGFCFGGKMTKEIQLTRGHVALVSDVDFNRLSQRGKWYASGPTSNKFYACREEGRKSVLMHRVVLNAPDGFLVDHINGNTLDNRRENLRLCNKTENLRNRGKTKLNSVGYKGVTRKRGRFSAGISVGGKHISLGSFSDPIEAARAYDAAAKKYFGEFAWFNFPNK